MVTKKANSDDNGWLSPEGDFFACPHDGHTVWIESRDSIFSEFAAERLGWIKLSRGEWFTSNIARKLSINQFTFIYEWCQKRSVPMPPWAVTDNGKN